MRDDTQVRLADTVGFYYFLEGERTIASETQAETRLE